METITLLGAEEVARAGTRISIAAATMAKAADQIEESHRQQRFFLEQWLERFKEIQPSPAIQDAPVYVDTKGAAKILCCSTRTIRHMVAQGHIRKIHIGTLVRYSLAELQSFSTRP